MRLLSVTVGALPTFKVLLNNPASDVYSVLHFVLQIKLTDLPVIFT